MLSVVPKEAVAVTVAFRCLLIFACSVNLAFGTALTSIFNREVAHVHSRFPPSPHRVPSVLMAMWLGHCVVFFVHLWFVVFECLYMRAARVRAIRAVYSSTCNRRYWGESPNSTCKPRGS